MEKMKNYQEWVTLPENENLPHDTDILHDLYAIYVYNLAVKNSLEMANMTCEIAYSEGQSLDPKYILSLENKLKID